MVPLNRRFFLHGSPKSQAITPLFHKNYGLLVNGLAETKDSFSMVSLKLHALSHITPKTPLAIWQESKIQVLHVYKTPLLRRWLASSA